MAHANIFLGTSSFSEPDWVGNFYPAYAKPAEFLAYYAKTYKTVEVDATYYAVPAQKTVESWYKRTPDNFILAAKFPKTIVHCGDGPKPDSSAVLVPEKTYPERDKFLAVMSHMKEKLGPLLIQFPYFSASAFASAEPFIQRLDKFLGDLPAEYRYAVEIRNKSWLSHRFSDMLASHKVALALTDQAWMPHGDEVGKLCNPETADFGYVRLIGDRQEIEAITTKWDKEVIDRGERLQRWADVLIGLSKRQARVLAYINNHFAGHAPTTLANLQQLLER